MNFFQFLTVVCIPGSRGNAIIACRWSGISRHSRQYQRNLSWLDLHGGKHGVPSVCAAQLVLTRRHAVNCYKEPTALGHPLRNCVRQRFADGQIHPRSVIARQTWCKAEKVGRAVPCTPRRAQEIGAPGVRTLPVTSPTFYPQECDLPAAAGSQKAFVVTLERRRVVDHSLAIY